MNKKITMVGIFIMFLVITGCNRLQKESGIIKEATDEKITITMWDYLIEGSDTTELIKSYENVYPNVKIDRKFVPFSDIKNKLIYAAAIGEMPDVLLIDDLLHQTLAAMGILLDITDEVLDWGQSEVFSKEPWETCIYEEKIFGLPMGVHNLALFYNEDMLKIAGVLPPENWDELANAAEKLTTTDVVGFQVTAVKNQQSIYTFMPFIWQSDSDIRRLNSKGTVEAIELWKNMLEKGYMPKEILMENTQTLLERFNDGKVAMMVNASWQVKLLNENAKINWGVVKLPRNQEEATSLGGENWAITSTSLNKEAAWDFIKFAQEPQNLKPLLLRTGRLPARKDLIHEAEWQSDKNMKVFVDSLEISRSHNYGVNYPEITLYLQDMLQQTLSGYKSPEEAVEEVYIKIKPLL
ncbi:carbohydrate ABC transporter substrate-binding protein, CUT1 family [Anaerovirgula multivorans]|uniref:Carbohydrate ABC transporter substrate-binding protein, CUT1 family n=1 Tax=Anaerovirgula multivorans TaxID=312168 RepID=A0A239GCV9_9FIRM|nr:sugar ABC transporter substrate-binding protein [Anaerovirgula multivorans]SNS66562.1 carbohydrate ABC transporter substrate-binding protein, CUT1 family [Anaerovirgula multivorans]